jgi:hypothetical protein
MGEFLGVAPEMISQAATDLGIADQLPPVLMGTKTQLFRILIIKRLKRL